MRIIPIILLIVGVILIMLGSIMITERGIFDIKNIDCYDKYGNKIIDLVCEEKIYESEGLGFLLFVVGMIILFFTTIYFQ